VRRLLAIAVVAGLARAPVARAALWEDSTAGTIGTTAGWSNKVELADINGDGRVDILFANGGNYRTPGTPELNRVFLNNGPGNAFTDATEAVLGSTPDLARVIKVRDVSGDGNPDIIVGTTYQTQSRLYLGDGSGNFTEVTSTNLPQIPASVGDIAVGDVDGDGDLDLVVADWGAGNPQTNRGGRTMLWLNDGTGVFTDATATKMPDVLVRFSWDLELVDVDNDYDLDVLVSCKSCTGSFLFHNDGSGVFTDASSRLPQFTNNYEFEAMDVDGDGYLDLATINDGPNLREHIFLADGAGGFTDGTATWFPASANLGEDDNMVVWLDADSDGDADFLIGSLSGADRLLRHGDSSFSVEQTVVSGAATPGTLGVAVADLDGDHRLDLVMSQGEVADPDKVYFGVDIPVDTAPPFVGLVAQVDSAARGDDVTIRARVHDTKSPTMPQDWTSVTLRWSVDGGSETDTDMRWYGEYLWRATLSDVAFGSIRYRVCATDAAGNETCSAPHTTVVSEAGSPDAGTTNPGNDAGTTAPGGGGCCNAGSRGRSGNAVVLLLVVAMLGVRRRRCRVR